MTKKFSFTVYEGSYDRETFAPCPHDTVVIRTDEQDYQAAIYEDPAGKPLDEVVDDLIAYVKAGWLYGRTEAEFICPDWDNVHFTI